MEVKTMQVALGLYRTRGGETVQITRDLGGVRHHWEGIFVDRKQLRSSVWADGGEYQLGEPNHPDDLVERIEESAAKPERENWRLASHDEVSLELTSDIYTYIDRASSVPDTPDYHQANITFVSRGLVMTVGELDANGLRDLADMLRDFADVIKPKDG